MRLLNKFPFTVTVIVIAAMLAFTLPSLAEEKAYSRRKAIKHGYRRDFSDSDLLHDNWETLDGKSLVTIDSKDPRQGDALAIPVEFPEKMEIWLEKPISLVNLEITEEHGALIFSRLAYSVFVPESFRGRVQSALLLKEKDGLFYSATTTTPLRPGRWNRVFVDLSKDSVDVLPKGHTSRWNLLRLCTLQKIGFAFWSDQPLEKTNAEQNQQILLDDITTWPLDTSAVRSREEFSIVNLHIDAPEVEQYGTFELSCWISRPVINPFDQEHVRINAFITPPGEDAEILVPLFYYQDFLRHKVLPDDRYTMAGPGIFKLRFTPRKSGVYRYRLEADYTSLDEMPGVKENYETGEYSFAVTPRDHPGFVRKAKEDYRYFENEDGSFYFPIGHNFRSPYDLRDWQMILKKRSPVPVDRGLNIYEEYIPKMAAAKENFIEVWMSSWWLALEWNTKWKGYHGLGYYNLENAWKLDELINLCQQYDIKIQLVIDNHGKASMKPQYDYEWQLSPYNIRQNDSKLGNNGFLNRPEELFDLKKNPRVRKHYRNLLRYIAARWGYSTNIFSFEMWSELDLVGKVKGRKLKVYGHRTVHEWHREMIDYLHSVDHGRHVVTTHYSGKFPYVDKTMVRLPQIDFIACDGYRENRESLVNLLLKTDRFAIPFKKPYMITEFGGAWNAAEPHILQGDLHIGLWTSWVSNASGTPLFWWFEHIDRADLYHHFTALANFIEGEDKRRGKGDKPLVSWPAKIKTSLGGPIKKLKSLGLGDGSIVYMWIYDQGALYSKRNEESKSKHSKVKITIPNMTEREYIIEMWDTWEGTIIDRIEVSAVQRNLELVLPDFRNDIAVKIKPLEMNK